MVAQQKLGQRFSDWEKFRITDTLVNISSHDLRRKLKREQTHGSPMSGRDFFKKPENRYVFNVKKFPITYLIIFARKSKRAYKFVFGLICNAVADGRARRGSPPHRAQHHTFPTWERLKTPGGATGAALRFARLHTSFPATLYISISGCILLYLYLYH